MLRGISKGKKVQRAHAISITTILINPRDELF